MRDPRQQGEPVATDGNDKDGLEQHEPFETIQDLEPAEDDADSITGGISEPPGEWG
jgi:hypothetical protein